VRQGKVKDRCHVHNVHEAHGNPPTIMGHRRRAHRAEAYLLRSSGLDAEAIILLTDRSSRRAVASVARVEEYLYAFAPDGGGAAALPWVTR